LKISHVTDIALVDETPNSDHQITNNTLGGHETKVIQELRSEIREKTLEIGKLENSLRLLKEDFSKEALEKEISNLKTDLLLSEACVTSLNEERRQLELNVMNNESVDRKIIEELRAHLQVKDEAIELLEEKVAVLNQDLLHLKQGLEKSEFLPDGILASSGKPVINEETEQELEELRASYFAAQEWMENAVQYHESLSEQVSTLQAEKTQLERNLEELKKKNTYVENQIHETQENLNIAVGSLEESAGIRDRLESQLKSLENELTNRQEEIQVLEAKVNTKSRLPPDLEAELLMLREVRLGLDETREFQELKINELQSEVNSLTRDLEEKQLDIDDLTTKLKEYESWSEAAQNRMQEMDSEKEALEQKLLLANSFNQNVELLTDEITNLKLLNQELQEKSDVKSAEVTGLNLDLEQQKDLYVQLEKSFKCLELKSQESESQLLNQIKELESK
jgi:tropomyosin, fungi type